MQEIKLDFLAFAVSATCDAMKTISGFAAESLFTSVQPSIKTLRRNEVVGY